MISDAKNVTDYLKEIPEKRRAALTKMQQLCNEVWKVMKKIWLMEDKLIRKTNALKLGLQIKKNTFVFIVWHTR
jgi:hypothetical protein